MSLQVTTVVRPFAIKGSSLAIFALAAAWSRPTGAETAASTSAAERSYSVDFSAAPGCPDLQSFNAAIRRRSPSARPSAPDTATLRLKVVLAPKEASRPSELTLDAGDSVRVERIFAGASCFETMEAMAVIAAVALDADRGATSDGSAEKGPPPPQVGVSESQPAAAALGHPRRPVTRSTQGSVSHFRVGFLGLALVQQNVGKGFAPGGGLGTEVASTSTSLLSPSIRLSAFRAASQITVNGGGADLRLLATRVELCPFWVHTGSLASAVCPVVDLGQLRATGKDVRNPRGRNSLWFGAGLGLRLELRLAKRISWGVAGAVEGRFRRDLFIFSPNSTVYQVAGIDGDLSTSLVFFVN